MTNLPSDPDSEPNQEELDQIALDLRRILDRIGHTQASKMLDEAWRRQISDAQMEMLMLNDFHQPER